MGLILDPISNKQTKKGSVDKTKHSPHPKFSENFNKRHK